MKSQKTLTLIYHLFRIRLPMNNIFQESPVFVNIFLILGCISIQHQKKPNK